MGRGDKSTSVEMSDMPLRGTAAAENADEASSGTIEAADDHVAENTGARAVRGSKRKVTRDPSREVDRDTEDEDEARSEEGNESLASSLGALATIGEDGPAPANLPAAFELIAEASAAVKIAEDRVQLAESALEDATSYYAGQIEVLTEKLNVADRRAEVAEMHAARAEERLRMFCQTILTTMHGQ